MEISRAAEEVGSEETKYIQIEEDNGSLNRPGQPLQVQLFGDQTNIYEELDQLVELMTQDKTAVTQKISQLEEHVKGLQQHKHILEAANEALQQKNSNLQQDLESQQEQKETVLQEAGSLDDAQMSAKSELQKMNEQVEALSDQLAHAKNANVELKKKLLEMETEHKNVARTLVVQQSENTQIVHQLSSLKEQCSALRMEKDKLSMIQNKLQQRLTASQNALQALKGRATNNRKYNEQLKMKCSSLQSALDLVNVQTPTVIKVSAAPQRTREELRLREECRKKDEMLASSAKELSVRQEEQRKLNFQLCNVMKSVKVERGKSENLSRAMESLREEKEEVEKEMKQRSRKYAQDLIARKLQDEFNLGKADVETNLSRIEQELEVVKGVVKGLRQKVEYKEGKWRQERLRWEDERTRLVKIYHEAMKSKQFREEGPELIQIMENYKRLKVASTRRCTELATEVWRLKNQLEDQQESPKSFNNSQAYLSLTNS